MFITSLTTQRRDRIECCKRKKNNTLGEKITIEDGDTLMLNEDAPECLKKCADYGDLVALW